MSFWYLQKNSSANAGDERDMGSIPGLGRFPRVEMATHSPVFLPGNFQGQRILAGYSPLEVNENPIAINCYCFP